MANIEVESSQQQSTIRQRIKNLPGPLLGLVFVVLLFSVVLIKVLELSSDVEDSRRLLKELTNKLVKTQKENEDLRKQLVITNATVETILRKFSSAQKVSQARRQVPVKKGKTKPPHKCHKVNACLQNFIKEHQPNCTSLRNCMSERKPDFLQLYGLGVNKIIKNRETTGLGENISWQSALTTTQRNDNNAITPDKIHININRIGTYRVYCSIRVGTKYIEKVSIKLRIDGRIERESLFSSSLTYNSNNSISEVRLSGLTEIRKGTKLFVQVKFTDQLQELLRGTFSLQSLKELFPDFSNNSNFGVFSVN